MTEKSESGKSRKAKWDEPINTQLMLEFFLYEEPKYEENFGCTRKAGLRQIEKIIERYREEDPDTGEMLRSEDRVACNTAGKKYRSAPFQDVDYWVMYRAFGPRGQKYGADNVEHVTRILFRWDTMVIEEIQRLTKQKGFGFMNQNQLLLDALRKVALGFGKNLKNPKRKT